MISLLRPGVTLLLSSTLTVMAAGPAAVSNPAPATVAPIAVAAEAGVRWKDLTPVQQTALKPLEHEWPRIESPHKQKWIELSKQVPKMTPAERTRIQARMAEWARLTPIERGRARLNFEDAKQIPPQDRQARWAAYQALDPEQKRQLAARAASAASTPGEAARRAASTSASGAASARAARDASQTKSNIVPNPAFAAPPKPIAPSVLQAQPGATTTLISKRPSPPAHQQTGMPKIAATPGFVNKTTLLPQRGPQGAAAPGPAIPTSVSEPAARR